VTSPAQTARPPGSALATRASKKRQAAPKAAPVVAAGGEPGRAAAGSTSSDLTPIVGANLRRLRVQRGLSLERLAQASGVSRAMLSQVELGRSTPTINVVWRIAHALEVPFSALIASRQAQGHTVLRQREAKVLSSHDGTFTSRALFPFDEPRRVEFYELRLTPGTVERAVPHPPGTVENLVLTTGKLVVEVEGASQQLEPGDAIVFQADVPHAYLNVGAGEAVIYLVMTYAEQVG
jgi:transcriptional regulator with XRE-family HTH domain